MDNGDSRGDLYTRMRDWVRKPGRRATRSNNHIPSPVSLQEDRGQPVQPARPRAAEPLSTSDIPGFPGYRTRQGRSGLDPLDTYQEEAHMTGFLIREFFLLRIRTRNPLFLGLMFGMGMLIFMLAVLLIFSILTGFPDEISGVGAGSLDRFIGLSYLTVLVILALVFGVILLLTFVINLVTPPVPDPENNDVEA